ncbi:MAG: type I-G CRISPR-associated protein Csb2 [Stellaceae bacterium]
MNDAPTNSAPPATARWRLARPIPLTLALPVGERLRDAALGQAAEVCGGEAVPWVISGHDLPERAQHHHAFYLSEDADGDGWIDHLVVHAEAGLAPLALAALRRLNRLFDAALFETELLELWTGDGRTARAGGTLLGTARLWLSTTPYLPPWHRKKRGRGSEVGDYLRRECAQRGLPVILRVGLFSDLVPPLPEPPVRAFWRERRGHLPPPYLPGWFLAVEFAEPVSGPLALGYGCHFGLGVFCPAEAA